MHAHKEASLQPAAVHGAQKHLPLGGSLSLNTWAALMEQALRRIGVPSLVDAPSTSRHKTGACRGRMVCPSPLDAKPNIWWWLPGVQADTARPVPAVPLGPSCRHESGPDLTCKEHGNRRHADCHALRLPPPPAATGQGVGFKGRMELPALLLHCLRCCRCGCWQSLPSMLRMPQQPAQHITAGRPTLHQLLNQRCTWCHLLYLACCNWPVPAVAVGKVQQSGPPGTSRRRLAEG